MFVASESYKIPLQIFSKFTQNHHTICVKVRGDMHYLITQKSVADFLKKEIHTYTCIYGKHCKSGIG